MLESFNSDKLEYQKLSPEEMKSRGILGRLVGVIADYKNPTRNGRLYSGALWEKVFADPIVQEKIKNRVMLGELCHPADRLEVDPEKAAICLAEVPKKGKDGKLYGVFDIIDTPNGRILKTFCDYGCNIGISSRGNGETTTDFDGNESVIPDSYQFECFDTVLVPGVEAARLTYMTEGLENKKTLKQALNESLEKASDEDKKVMKETLDELNIDYSDSKEESNNIEDEAAKDDGAELVKTLQESLLAKEEAEAKVTELQEKLSVCYAKEAKYEEDISKYKNAIRNLSEAASSAKKLQNKVQNLTEELENKNNLIQEKDNKAKDLSESITLGDNEKQKLSENLSIRDRELRQANRKISILTEEVNKKESEHKQELNKLEESIQILKKDSKLKETQYSTKLERANKLVEQYRNKAQAAVNRYIESKALVLGITAQEIKNRLTENYTFDDIDAICENLSNYSLQVSNLPFNLRSVKKVNLTESAKIPGSENLENDADEIDENLLRLANKLNDN